MDKASDFGSEDCRFESCHDRYLFAFYLNSFMLILFTVWWDLFVKSKHLEDQVFKILLYECFIFLATIRHVYNKGKESTSTMYLYLVHVSLKVS